MFQTHVDLIGRRKVTMKSICDNCRFTQAPTLDLVRSSAEPAKDSLHFEFNELHYSNLSTDDITLYRL